MDQKYLNILMQGVEAWNDWKKNAGLLEQPDLVGADFADGDLSGIDLSGVDLRKVDFRNVFLRGANLLGANLSGVDLSEADLSGANLRGADLRDADLSGTDLSGTDLLGANLSGVDLSGADLSGTDLRDADLSGAFLAYANLRDALLIGTNLAGTILSHCTIHGIAVWNVNLEGAAQDNLVITRRDEPTITVDNIEVSQFIYLLLNHQKIRQTIDTITSQVALILGSFPPDRKEVVDALSRELHSRKYSPVVFNFEGAENKDVTATVRTLANMARFVLLDLTNLDDAMREIADDILPRCVVPTQPLLLQDSHQQGYELFLGRKHRWVLPPYRYKDLPHLQTSFQEKVLQPINEKIIELRQKKPLCLFIEYAPEDKKTLNILKTHLRPFERAGLIEAWDDQMVAPGEEKGKEIEKHLSDAHIILLLISPDFLSSQDCYDIQNMAIERHNRGEAKVIPILLRPCAWQSTPLKELQPLPKDKKPISRHNKDDVFFEVSEGIGEVIKTLR